jgi:hypothetical protein
VKRSRSMTIEQCAARMTQVLSRPPRKAKTRAYVATLPKPASKRTISVDEYSAAPAEPADRIKAILARCPPLPKPKPPVFIKYEPSPRVDRVRPRKEVTYLIERMAEAQKGLCILCGTRIFFDVELPDWAPQRASFDHVLPRSRGGVNVGNRLAAHRRCNEDKGNRMPTGCELVWLAAVNAKLGIATPESGIARLGGVA